MSLDIEVLTKGEGTVDKPFTAVEGEFTEADFNRLKSFTIGFTSFYIRYKSQIVLMAEGRAIYPLQKAA